VRTRKGDEKKMDWQEFIVVFNQPGPIQVMDHHGTIWQAYRQVADIPNLKSGPHLARIRAREIKGGD
jgi:hypothetical protein